MPTNDSQRLETASSPKADVLRYFHPVMPAARLRKEPIGVRIAERGYVLFRDGAGRPGALDDACPHRRAPLSRGRVQRDGRLACGYHGWSFDIEGRGRSPSSPELRRCDTRAYRVIERLGYLWMANQDVPESALPEIPSDGFEFAGSISARFDASMEVTLDNISEDEHFAFVHSTFGWNASDASTVAIETDTFADRSEVRLSGVQRRSRLAPLGGVRSGDRFRNQWVTRFAPVHSIYTFWWEDPRSGAKRPITTRAAVFLVPEAPLVTHAHMFLFLAIAPSLQKRFRPISQWLARRIAKFELDRDARIAAQLADQPTTLRGMRLTRFDEALIHNRKLLSRLYWQERKTTAEAPELAVQATEEAR